MVNGYSTRLRTLVVGLGVASTLACGGAEDEGARVPSMTGNSASARADRAGPNEAPTIEGVSLSPARPVPGRKIGVRVEVDDPDGDRTTLSYEWRTADGRVLGSGRNLETIGLQPGASLELEVVASDGIAESEAFVESFSLAEPSVAVALVGIESDDGNRPGTILEAYVESTDESVGGYDVLYSWTVDGVEVGNDDELDTARLSPGDVVVLAVQFEFNDRITRPVRSSPFVLGRGAAPEIVSSPEAGIEGGVFRYQMEATSEVAGAEIEYALIEGPEGMRVDPTSGQVEWRPAPGQTGRIAIELVARDQWGTGTAQSFALQVDPPASPPASPR